MFKFKFSSNVESKSVPMLLEAARYGDENAFRELTKRTYYSVKKYCCQMGSNLECEDLTQETFLRALKGNVPISNTENLEAYMITIAKCVCADWLRSKAKTNKIYAGILDQGTDSFYLEDLEITSEILNILEDEIKELVILNVLLGFSYQECSEILGIPIGTVRSRISRAKNLLKRKIISGKLLELG